MRPGSRLMMLAALGAAFVATAQPVRAEQRWLTCKFTDQLGAARNFFMVFDDLRSTASLFDAGTLIEGTDTSINFQSIRTRFPTFALTYNRNDGALAVSPLEATYGGILRGECRRTAPPPGAPRS
jgi:hypothetical protein